MIYGGGEDLNDGVGLGALCIGSGCTMNGGWFLKVAEEGCKGEEFWESGCQGST